MAAVLGGQFVFWIAGSCQALRWIIWIAGRSTINYSEPSQKSPEFWKRQKAIFRFSSTSYPPPATRPDDEVLVRVEGVSKKFCRSLKKSLWYGVCDIAGELLPGRKRQEKAYLTTIERHGGRENDQLKVGPKGEGVGTTESKDTESTEGKAWLRLGGQAGAAFSNPSASELARDSENTSLTRCAGDPALALRTDNGEVETAGGNQRADSGEFLEGHSQASLQMDSEKLATIRSANAPSGSGANASSAEIGEICGKQSDASHGAGLRPGEFWAVKDVSFELRRGECLGLIGHNGAGKTTLLKMLNGLIKPDAGAITMRGRGASWSMLKTPQANGAHLHSLPATLYLSQPRRRPLGLTKKELQ